MTSPWFWVPRRRPGAALRLCCFPHAGGDAPSYAGLARELPETVEVHALRMPGRGGSSTEPRATGLQDLVDKVTEDILTLPGPYALLGQSLGGLIAYEVARAATAAGRPPAAVVLASLQAPHRWLPAVEKLLADGVPAFGSAMPDLLQGFVAFLRDGNEEVSAALDDPRLRQVMLAGLWEDFALFRGYAYRPEPKLGCPLHALSGSADPGVSADDMGEWAAYTTGAFSLSRIPAGHLVVQTGGAHSTRVITRLLAPEDS
ncbi:thioesterase II family protein [Streptosporangium sp. NPDC000396]|uniref:thioesterase II family protein n=1 Tax=Streptosporangium sp. NPDC000396 TaxID=3366185 RepID=UPI0036AACAA4